MVADLLTRMRRSLFAGIFKRESGFAASRLYHAVIGQLEKVVLHRERDPVLMLPGKEGTQRRLQSAFRIPLGGKRRFLNDNRDTAAHCGVYHCAQ